MENPVFRESYGRLIIPLNGPNKYEIKKNFLHRVGLRQLIAEVQLERYGRLLFHAPNQFNDPAQLSDWFRPHFVQEMVEEGIITIVQSGQRATTTVGKRPFRFQFGYQ